MVLILKNKVDSHQKLNKMIPPSELILNPDGSVYHLHLKPEHIAKKIILSGDPERIQLISDHFDYVEHKIRNREFVTHTGSYNGERISAIATGIGTDNIDIVINELDALVNIDLKKRVVRKKHTELQIVRIGTCGSLQKELQVDTAIFSAYSMGMDGLMHFYKKENHPKETAILESFMEQSNWPKEFNRPYIVEASTLLSKSIGKHFIQGITLTTNGFYGPQGRVLRLELKEVDFMEKLRAFQYNDLKILNLEMESSAVYGLSQLLGHQACTVCTVVANRYANKFTKNHLPSIQNIIEIVLKALTNKGE